MIGDTVIADGIELVVAWDGALPPRQTVIPVSPNRYETAPCGCGCGRIVSPPARYASYACAGRGIQGKTVAERVRRGKDFDGCVK